MRQWRLSGILFLVLSLSSCMTMGRAPADPQRVPDDFAGMCPHDNTDAAERAYLDALDVSWIRQGFFWNTVENKPGQWDFSRYDAYVANARADGRKVLVVLDYDTDWIRPASVRAPLVPRDFLPAWTEYVRRVVERYDGPDIAFEIWNEPNLWLFWAGTRNEFVDLAMATVRTIRAVRPQARVIGPGFFGLPRDWIEALDAAGFWSLVDGAAFHPYWLDAEGTLAIMAEARALYHRMDPDLELWVTEVGFPTGGWYWTSSDLGTQAQRVAKVLAGAAALGMDKVLWYISADYWPRGKAPADLNSEAYFGLAWRDFEWKPGSQAFAVLAPLLQGARYDPALFAGTAEGGVFLPFRTADDRLLLVAWGGGLGRRGQGITTDTGAAFRVFEPGSTAVEAEAHRTWEGRGDDRVRVFIALEPASVWIRDQKVK